MNRTRRNGRREMGDLFGPRWFDDPFNPHERRRAGAQVRREEPEQPPRAEHVEKAPEPVREQGEPEVRRPDDRDLLHRVQADFINYKRRVEQDREQQGKSANRELILRILPAVDDLQRALRSVPQDMAETEWGRGMALIERKLMATLEAEGLERMDAEGQEFDPREHEAVFCDECSQVDKDVVKSVVRDGYRLHDKVIRPAQVVVSKANDMPPEPVKVRVRRRRV